MQPIALQTFPDFNIYSTPLLILAVQGLILCALLYVRYVRKRMVPDVLLASILLIMCYHRTTYTIGFMGWYDTFRNTKINYYLISMELLMAPLIYFYVKSLLSKNFGFRPVHGLHALPWILFLMAKVMILVYDAQQPGFDDNQNGYLVLNFQWKYLNPLVTIFASAQMLLYLAFSFQLFFQYQKNIQQFFSNILKKELNWIRIFLFVYTFIFLYGIFQIFVDEYVMELSWTQKWWIQFLSAIALLYFGVKGYFTNFDFLKDFKRIDETTLFDNVGTAHREAKNIIKKGKENIITLFEHEKVFLNPELNLSQVSQKANLNRAEVSEIINSGFGKNFNDFVNHFRIEEFKKRLLGGEHQQFSLVGLAFECGFNSKATFNRVFKREVKLTPTEYLNSLKNKGLK